MAEAPQNHCEVRDEWLEDSTCQAILKETHIIAFEYDAVRKWQKVSSFIGEYIAGNYDGRLLSDVMLEDGVIHPDDLNKSVSFRDRVAAGQLGEMTLRLKTPEGDYRWFRMVLTPRPRANGRVLVGILEDVDIQMRYQALLRRRSEIDSVSGIYNRDTYFRQTQKLLEQEADKPHFLFCFDVERFKLINELFGSDEGDRVLRRIGDTLHGLALPGETFGRLGNDLFSMCVCRSREDALSLLGQIIHQIQSYPLAFRLFLPAGIVPVPAGCTDRVNVLCDRAILAQRQSKGNYLRTYTFYEESMGQKLGREHQLIAHMEEALIQGQFLAYFQPQYDMRSGCIIGVEALARWRHPTLGMISPAEFIPLFERNGFVLKLDEYIWDFSCRTIRSWLDSGLTPMPISVNVSRVHLFDPDFVDKVTALCRRYALPSSLLRLEITESVYMERPHELYPVMDRLHRAGFTLEMDDFGSGYSSLNILKDIPVNVIKFDLRFLENARNGEHVGQSILRNVIRLIKDLDLVVVAEGVETEKQVRLLRDMDCHYAQGFFYARPLPLEEFEALLYPSR